MTKKKYVIFPGWIRSKNDGDRHFIGVGALAELYQVNLSECLVYDDHMPSHFYDGLIRLHPKYNGDYTIPEKVDNG